MNIDLTPDEARRLAMLVTDNPAPDRRGEDSLILTKLVPACQLAGTDPISAVIMRDRITAAGGILP